MRILALAIAVVLTAVPAAAQDDQQPLDRRVLDLPVSLERIREGLASDKPSILDALDVQATFRVEVQEKRPSFVEMFSPESFKGGPVPPGGLYAYEQQRMLFPNSTPALFSLRYAPGVPGHRQCDRRPAPRTGRGRGARRGRAGHGRVLRRPAQWRRRRRRLRKAPVIRTSPPLVLDNPTRESVAQVMQSRYA